LKSCSTLQKKKKKPKIDERWLSREQLFADNHGVRNHRRRLIDHELFGQSAAVCIFGVAGVCFMRKAVWSKHDFLRAHMKKG
jgi:hypothetical protein